MKDIKSMIIGFLLATCMFLFMGNTENDKQVDESKIVSALNDINLTLIEGNKNGRYQITNLHNIPYDNSIYETILDTKTGEIFNRKKLHSKSSDWGKRIKNK
tara:strand:+ start:991 stop:1296 length:306 start_codon:yes stop_codon:yes gene_type:complete